jgi:hypothetical protein
VSRVIEIKTLEIKLSIFFGKDLFAVKKGKGLLEATEKVLLFQL